MQEKLEVVLRGGASQNEEKWSVDRSELAISLMHYLQRQGVPVASSCDGAGVCQKCVVTFFGKKMLSCQLREEDFSQYDSITIIIDYI